MIFLQQYFYLKFVELESLGKEPTLYLKWASWMIYIHKSAVGNFKTFYFIWILFIESASVSNYAFQY